MNDAEYPTADVRKRRHSCTIGPQPYYEVDWRRGSFQPGLTKWQV